MKTNGIAPFAIGVLVAATSMSAAASTPLATGGRTLAGPGKTAITAGLTATVYTHPAINTDVCTTVSNDSKTSAVRITLVDDSANETLLDLAAGRTGALCENEVTRMDLTCVGETNCTAQWRIDVK